MKSIRSCLTISALTALCFAPNFAHANSGDFSGGVAIGTGYAGVSATPTNGMIVQGNVGIGTTSPATNLEITPSAFDNGILVDGNARPRVIVNSENGTPTRIFSREADWYAGGIQTNLSWPGQYQLDTTTYPGWEAYFSADQDFFKIDRASAGTNPRTTSNLFSILGSGNVGIGTASPSYPLDVNGQIRSYSNGYNLNYPAATYRTYSIQTAGLNRWVWGSDATSESGSNAGSNFYLQAWTDAGAGAAVPIYIVRSSGNVGISNTSPAHLLHVGSSSASGIVMELQNSSGACTYTPGASSVTVSCSSDMRFKRDVADSENAMTWVKDMRVRDFTVKATGERRTGVVAQEVSVTHPELVHADADGFYTVDEPNPWKLVKAIQELKADNDKLRSEFEAYKQTHP